MNHKIKTVNDTNTLNELLVRIDNLKYKIIDLI